MSMDHVRYIDKTREYWVIYSNYSQRRSMEVDAPEVLRQCREDGADAILLCAV